VATKNENAKKAALPVIIWDTAWKIVAIRRAVQLKHYKMIPVLALAASGGIIPMGYLWKNRGKTAPEG
jgi:hypothetical protein